MLQSLNGDSIHAQEHVYSRLRSLVIGFEFRPGEHLRIPDLAQMLGVSATPIREALQRLYKESLITMTPHRGFYNRIPNLKEMRDLYGMLEVCLEAAIGDPETPRDDYKNNVGFYHNPVGTGPDLAARVALVESRLRWFAALAGNDVLYGTVDNLVDRTHTIRCLDLEAEAAFEEHIHAFDEARSAWATGSGEAARSSLSALHVSLQRRLPDLVKEALHRMHDGNGGHSALS